MPVNPEQVARIGDIGIDTLRRRGDIGHMRGRVRQFRDLRQAHLAGLQMPDGLVIGGRVDDLAFQSKRHVASSLG